MSFILHNCFCMVELLTNKGQNAGVKLEKKIIKAKVAVRQMVEFILRHGDIDSNGAGFRDPEAMKEGTRLHKKLQKKMGSNYSAEVPLKITKIVTTKRAEIALTVEGRADGIISASKKGEKVDCIDEIKGVYRDIMKMKEPDILHLAQAKCYAYIWAEQKQLEKIGVRMTYGSLINDEIRYFNSEYKRDTLEQWFMSLVKEYADWIERDVFWKELRNQSIKETEFPYPYRKGQKELVVGVYRTILREKNLYLQAPTGVGKTLSTVFPSVKAVGEGLTDKIFYLTAKTITVNVAEEAFSILSSIGLKMKILTITAKEKICVLEKAECNPIACQRAKGHYDRINDAVFALLEEQNCINREIILEYAKKYQVCPFEMCLDAAIFADAIVCDYNYAFDPNIALKRFFEGAKKEEFLFLVDEAHNLVDRGREMYSALLTKEEFLARKKEVDGYDKKLARRFQACNHFMLEWKRETEEFHVWESNILEKFILELYRTMTECEKFLQEYTRFAKKEELLDLYFSIRHFVAMYERVDEKYKVYTNFTNQGEFQVKLQCMDPSANLKLCLEKARSAIFFSATFLPIRYYKQQLAGIEEDYAIYADTPFEKEKRLLLIGQDVSTKYTRRNAYEYDKMIEYILKFTEAKLGNYIVFFPSYQYLEEIDHRISLYWKENFEQIEILRQTVGMKEEEKEQYLSYFFKEEDNHTKIGFCVMGGMFSEGIDLKGKALIGAVIVGTGLPMVCKEREMFLDYYNERNGAGFSYAYLYPGMNKVLQSAGRVIRTTEDIGAILLLDERFMQRQYQTLFPREWYPYQIVNRENISYTLEKFWEAS